MSHNTDNSDLDEPSLDELISLREAAELSGLSASHLRLRGSRGEIRGVRPNPCRNTRAGPRAAPETWSLQRSRYLGCDALEDEGYERRCKSRYKASASSLSERKRPPRFTR
jgi:hypothetical protein